MIRLQHERIDVDEVIRSVLGTSSGAVDVFIGTTRDRANGKPVRTLAYEAHELMAVREIEKIAAEASQRWKTDRISVVHRLGLVKVGEASVVVAVSSAHRAEAFEACRFVIDTLKKDVPIWKQEVYEDGSSEWPGHLSVQPSNIP